MKHDKRIWITWLNQRRNKELAREMQCSLYSISYDGNRLIRYLLLSYRTVQILRREKPKIVFAQNPSLILAILLIILSSKYLHFRVIIDSHNAGLFPIEGRSRLLNRLSKVIQQKASLTIVTNNALKEIVESNGGQAIILPDKIPHIPKKEFLKLKGEYNFLLVSSFSQDEPFMSAISAMRELSEKICLYVSGDFKKVRKAIIGDSDNVIFTGFVSDQEYFQLLHSVDGVINLTYRENCLLCGAYETVAVEKPLILSDKSVLKDYFHKGSIFVENDADSIRNGILKAIKNKESLCDEVRELKKELLLSWEKRKIYLNNLISA